LIQREVEKNNMQPESFNKETFQPDEPKPDDIRQPESQITNEDVRSTTILSRIKTFPISYYAIGSLILLLVIAVICLGGLGYWGYTLENDLTATRQQFAALQGKYASLESENNKLSTDLAQSNADLAQSNADLEKTKKELAASQKELNAKTKSIKDAVLRFTVLRKSLIPLTQPENDMASEKEFIAFFSDWIQSIEDVHDPILQSKFEDMVDAILAGKSGDGSFIVYLLDSIENDLK